MWGHKDLDESKRGESKVHVVTALDNFRRAMELAFEAERHYDSTASGAAVHYAHKMPVWYIGLTLGFAMAISSHDNREQKHEQALDAANKMFVQATAARFEKNCGTL